MPRRGRASDMTDTDQAEQDMYQTEQAEQAALAELTEQADGEQAASEQGEQAELTDEEKAAKAAAAAEALAAELADIEGFSEVPAELLDETTPQRKRNDKQRAMDAIAVRSYAAWVERGRPSVWAKLPVITYYLDPDKVADRRKLIRKACEAVKPQPYTRDDGERIEPTGVRVRFGAEEFVLTDEKAAKIGRPDDAGKTVLSWVAVDKRKSNRTAANGDGDGDGDE